METLELYSLTKSARLLHIGKDNLYNLIREGRLRTIKVGRRNKIPSQELQRFIEEEKKAGLNGCSLKPLFSSHSSVDKNQFSGKEIFRRLKEEQLGGKCL